MNIWNTIKGFWFASMTPLWAYFLLRLLFFIDDFIYNGLNLSYSLELHEYTGYYYATIVGSIAYAKYKKNETNK